MTIITVVRKELALFNTVKLSIIIQYNPSDSLNQALIANFGILEFYIK